ncbi:uncharacterized zinc finger CCHC domain-containing protein At4g19190 [Nicotiana sylvestris]|uniref:Uncharacterized zinc finger CCHC domain-containing protein At4g19190 n=1 Tax=Nicotiana sylvestris TaxID=4096 RepID=A0A1U7XB73_NICSY|nr:PREDICTED: uncharacterized zinc finger CCHC domain-containing protein At4g19190 [Nicotiana sylvestris]
MEEEGAGFRLSKRFSDKGGEVDYKTKAGTAWSHNFLNQKPWHPLSYPNQRRKWIAEQTHAQREQRANEIAREYAQEQEFFRQTALVSKKEKEKMEMMKAVSFMYVRPPGYNPESAKAAEIADEAQKQGQGHGGTSQDTSAAGVSTSGRPEVPPVQEKKKPRPKDVFGRLLPTEEEFEVLKNAPRLETGVAGRAKPFGIEIRNVKCVRCGAFGHQSGDRECPLKDAIMPNEESRIKRDDPLTAILAQTDASEPLKWELKQKPGLSPPRGGFNLDDPNQQIVAEDIFDEYGGFLTADNVPDLLASLSSKPNKKKKSSKSKHKKRSSPARPDLRDQEEITSSSDDDDRGRTLKKKKHKKKSGKHSVSSEDSDSHRKCSSNRQRHSLSTKRKHSESSSEDDDNDRHRKRSNRHRRSQSSSPEREDKEHRKKNHNESSRGKHSKSSSEDDNNDRHRKRNNRHRCSRSSSPVPEDKEHRKKKHSESSRGKHSESSSEDDNNDRHRKRSNRHRRSRSSSPVPKDKEHGKKKHSESIRGKHSKSSSEDNDNDRHRKRTNRHRHSRSSSPEPEDKDRRKKSRHYHHHHSRHNHSDYS